MLLCSKSGKVLDDKEGGVVASISGSFVGDEDTESYFCCSDRGVYTGVHGGDISRSFPRREQRVRPRSLVQGV